MLITSLLSWWYTDGWLDEINRIKWSFIEMADKFSIGLLIKTLFAPFRQIAADEQAGRGMSRGAVFVDKLISRMVGFVVRSITIVVGLVMLAGLAIISVIRLAAWPILPVAPIIGIVLSVAIGAPWKII